MAVCDKCGEEMDVVFEKGIWLCRQCYVKEVLRPKEAQMFDEKRAEELADVLYDDYWWEAEDE